MGYRENIQGRIDELGWTQRDLVIASGVNPATISRFLAGQQDLNVPQIDRIARALDRMPGDFLEKSDVDPMSDRLTPVIARLRPLRLEDQIRAVSALAMTLDTMLAWRGTGDARHGTEVRPSTYNLRLTNSEKSDAGAEEVYAEGPGSVREDDAPSTAGKPATRKSAEGKARKRR